MKADLILDRSEAHLYGVVGGVHINATVADGHGAPDAEIPALPDLKHSLGHKDAVAPLPGMPFAGGKIVHVAPKPHAIGHKGPAAPLPGMPFPGSKIIHSIVKGHTAPSPTGLSHKGLSHKGPPAPPPPMPLPGGKAASAVLKHLAPHVHKPKHKPLKHGHVTAKPIHAAIAHRSVPPGLYAMTLTGKHGKHGNIVSLNPLHHGHPAHGPDLVLHGPGKIGAVRSIELTSATEIAKICQGIIAASTMKHHATLMVTDGGGEVSHPTKVAALLRKRPH